VDATRVILVSDSHLSVSAPAARHELVEPDGLEQLTLTVDLPDPYHG
jgi:hypothetical protein